MRDVISASDWSENFEYAIRLVSKRGGPQAVLSSDPTNFTRRFLLENLTTHDIFSQSSPFRSARKLSIAKASGNTCRLFHYPERARPDGSVRSVVVLLHRNVISVVGMGIR
jgi:hypothetical protein